MSEKSGFFNAYQSANGTYDRTYVSEDLAAYFASFIGNGVFAGQLSSLMVASPDTSTMNIRVMSGKGWANGYWYCNTESMLIKLDNADGTLNRDDIVVLGLDYVERKMSVYIKKGTYYAGADGSPAIPEPVRNTTSKYELYLAKLKVTAGMTDTKNIVIEDLRSNAEYCGFVSGVVDQIDTTEYNEQVTEYVNKLVDELGDILDTENVTRLMEILDELKESTLPQAIARIDKEVDVERKRIDTLVASDGDSDTGWVVPTFASGDIIAPTAGAMMAYRVKNGVVHISGCVGVKNKVAGTMKDVFQIPAKYLPQRGGIAYTTNTATGYVMSRYVISSAGMVCLEWVRKLSDGNEVSGDIAWVGIDYSYAIDGSYKDWDAELQDARIDNWGVKWDSIGAAMRNPTAEFFDGAIEWEEQEAESQIGRAMETEIGGHLSIFGNESYRYVKVPCKEYDRILVYSECYYGDRAAYCTDENDTVLSRTEKAANATTSTAYDGLQVLTPAGTKYIWVTSHYSGKATDIVPHAVIAKWVDVKDRFKAVEDAEQDDAEAIAELGQTLEDEMGELKTDIMADNAGAHNAIYRGKYLGDTVTDEQYATIEAGTFKDLFIGDYWTINEVNWRIAAFDYYYNCGDTNCSTHHAVIVPDTCLYNSVMNDTNITTGGYVGSKMYTEGLEPAKTTINTIFNGHVLTHRILLTNAVANGRGSNCSWLDSTVDLMCEHMVYGSGIFSPVSDGSNVPYNHRVEKSQLPLFQHEPSRIGNRNNWWLRDVITAARFAVVGNYGETSSGNASYSLWVRPAFCICG